MDVRPFKKRLKLGSPIADAVESNEIVRCETEFGKMNDDCILKILDWLSIEELCAISSTCKRLLELGERHFARTYKREQVVVQETNGETRIIARNEYCQRFTSAVNKLNIRYSCFRQIPFIDIYFKREIKEIVFLCSSNSNSYKYLNAELLKNVENVSIYELENDVYQNMLKNCPMIKYLQIHEMDSMDCLNNETDSKTWPTLKHLQYTGDAKGILEELLQRFPNVTSFTTSYRKIEWLIKYGLKLDDLCIQNYIPSEELRMLQQTRQIKRLHLMNTSKDLFRYPELKSLKILKSLDVDCKSFKSASELINAVASLSSITLLKLKNVCKLEFNKTKAELFAKKMTQLEGLHIDFTSGYMDIIMPFVQHSSKLETIVVYYSWIYDFDRFTDSNYFQNLAKQRQQLKDACKLTIYLKEEHYFGFRLSTSTDNYGLVEIKRAESYQSNHPFFVFNPNYPATKF